MINANGVVITNRHVIADALIPSRAHIFVNPDGQLMNVVEDTWLHPNAEVVWTSESLDLAIIQTNGLHNVAPVVISTALPNPGDEVLAIGYPGDAERNDFKGYDIKSVATVTNGAFSRQILSTWDTGSRPLQIIQHSATLSPGDSGGPLLDSCRRVIGVNTQRNVSNQVLVRDGNGNLSQATSASPHINYASAISELLEILKQREVPVTSISAEPCRNGVVQSAAKVPAAPVQASAPAVAAELVKSSGGSSSNLLMIAGGVVVLLACGAFIALQRSRSSGAPQIVVTPAPAAPEPVSGSMHAKTRAIRAATIALGSTEGIPVVELVGSDDQVAIRILPGDLALGPVVIGREPPQEKFALSESSVSRQHFSLEFLDGKLFVSDENSLNGTSLDGLPLKAGAKAEVQSGQLITAGAIKLRVRLT
ncbi:trypsin-like peptidase domain-containing protein [Rhizomicrobium palustre]